MDEAEVKRRLEEDGFCVFPNVLSADELARVRDALDRAVERERRIMGSTYIRGLDPNANNIRVNNLPAADPVFIELLNHPLAQAAVAADIGPHFLVSNFTANIALPGSGSMKIHSDQALAVPEPWPASWAINVIWTLDDVNDVNGATRYLPGSHRFETLAEVPDDALEHTVAFQAPAGSFIAMDGRLWHTSGRNRAAGGQRRMMFAYYATDFLRQQANWAFALPAEVQAGMDAATLRLFGLEARGNARIGAAFTALEQA